MMVGDSVLVASEKKRIKELSFICTWYKYGIYLCKTSFMNFLSAIRDRLRLVQNISINSTGIIKFCFRFQKRFKKKSEGKIPCLCLCKYLHARGIFTREGNIYTRGKNFMSMSSISLVRRKYRRQDNMKQTGQHVVDRILLFYSEK